MRGDFVILGLPASGKTTFLAALWHLVASNEIECELTLERYEGDLRYLNTIAESWRKFEKVPRTTQSSDTDVTIFLSDASNGISGAAYFPDLAGETFDIQVESRKCRPKFIDGANRDSGLLLFINTDTKEDALSIVELNDRLKGLGLAEIGQSLVGTSPSTPPTATERKEWAPKLIPAQVRIVQLLSDFLDAPFDVKPRRTAIMVSAWDLASHLGLSPEAWLGVHMPLVHQFLIANKDLFEVRIYGLSAQGADLANEQAVDRMADLETPSHRIRIVDLDGEGHDLTLPLVWLMSDQ